MVSSGGGPEAAFTVGSARPDGRAGTRVGIFGGTFDPPHLGHAIVAGEVADALALDRLLWVPASIPPHKAGRAITPGGVRRRLVEAAIEDDPRFELCDLELERGGVSYTVDTLRSLRADHPRWSMWLVLGTDLLAGFSRWREPEAILGMARLAVMSRAGIPEETAGVPAVTPTSPRQAVPGGHHVRAIQVTPVDISSSQVRDRIRRKLAVRDMVTPPVLAVIEKEGLYGA